MNDLEIDVYNDFFLSKYLKKVLQALRRLKGNSDRKPKMSTETKIVFDQLTEDAMNYRDEPYIYWANPRTGEFIPVRLVAGSRPDQDGLINSDHGAIPESLVFRDTPENRLDIKDQWVAYRKLPYKEAFALFSNRVKIMKTRG